MVDKQVAVIDIGTNTMLLLTAAWDPDRRCWTGHQTWQRFSRIGENLKVSGDIPEKVMERNLACLGEFQAICQSMEIPSVYCFATSALRDAKNSGVFVQRVQKTLGIEIQIISGEREAQLICASVASLYQKNGEALFILDIGGGSTELIHWQQRRIQFLKSLNLGVVHLTHTFLKCDPALLPEIAECRSHIRHTLAQNYPPLPAGGTLVAIGGTATTAFCLINRLADYDPARVEGGALRRHQLERIFADLAGSTHKQRIQHFNLPPGRADVLLAGMLILIEEIKQLQPRQTLVSDRGLRYGVLEELKTQG